MKQKVFKIVCSGSMSDETNGQINRRKTLFTIVLLNVGELNESSTTHIKFMNKFYQHIFVGQQFMSIGNFSLDIKLWHMKSACGLHGDDTHV